MLYCFLKNQPVGSLPFERLHVLNPRPLSDHIGGLGGGCVLLTPPYLHIGLGFFSYLKPY